MRSAAPRTAPLARGCADIGAGRRLTRRGKRAPPRQARAPLADLYSPQVRGSWRWVSPPVLSAKSACHGGGACARVGTPLPAPPAGKSMCGSPFSSPCCALFVVVRFSLPQAVRVLLMRWCRAEGGGRGPSERADARRSRNGIAAIPRVVFRPRDPRRHSIAPAALAPDHCRASQHLHDAAATAYQRRDRSRRAESARDRHPRCDDAAAPRLRRWHAGAPTPAPPPSGARDHALTTQRADA